MSLTLKVISFKNKPITEIETVFIGNNGGSIGRSDDNTLVLPDTEKFVSRHHVTISMENGSYYLSDTSLGGIFINNCETPLHNATERIDNGMTFKVGEYEIAVSIEDEQVIDGFPFVNELILPEPVALLQAEEPWLELEEASVNSLMADNFPRHDELVQKNLNEQSIAFESGLQGNQSPLFDSYIAPGILQPSLVDEIPEDFNFEEFFSEGGVGSTHDLAKGKNINNLTVNDDFDDFFSAAIGEMAADFDLSSITSDTPVKSDHESSNITSNEPLINPLCVDKPAVIAPKIDTHHEDNEVGIQSDLVTENAVGTEKSVLAGNVLFNAFLQGANIKYNGIRPEQQTETLHRIGQMFRTLIDGTVAVLRSRAEFKSLCRVNMTVIRSTDNNPLKFTVSTDDVLRQLLENKAEGFLTSALAIEEAFGDIMNHQLAMQAGIQASLTDLLKTFDPKLIEKQFEQGIVLQKKARCWDRYQETYGNTAEDAVENFFGEEFVKAYEKQMQLLTSRTGKQSVY